MKALIQRVQQASVTVDDEVVGSIGRGLLVFLGVERGDDEQGTRRLAQRVLAYRVFPDEAGRMNLSVHDVGGDVLVVSQFTLAADTTSGNRPSFTPAAEPGTGLTLYECFAGEIRASLGRVQTGRFGADMQVALLNDGPVTFLLSIPPERGCTAGR